MEQHIKILGIVTIVYHGILALLIVIIVPIFLGASLLAEDAIASGIIGTVFTIITVVILALTLPGVIGGIGLLNHKSWGRIVTIIANALSLFSFPIGTALAVYSFWVLTREETMDLLD